MRFSLILLALGTLSSPAAADDSRSIFSEYRAQLAAQCPVKHLELLSPADVRDMLDDYKAGLPARVSHEMNRAEKRRCASSPGGTSCPNAADLEVAERHHIVAQVARQTCDTFATCRGQSDCDAMSTGAEDSTSAMQIIAMTRIRGARSAGATLSSHDFDRALRAASSGNADWLRVLVALRPGSDAARGEGIDGALSMALEHNPAEVLRLMSAHPEMPGPAWLCEDRAIEPTHRAVAVYRRQATKALQAVNDPGTAALRDQCLAHFRRVT